MMRRYDVIIVGGGPVGCLVGKLVSSQGVSVIVVEEHKEVGLPVKCAGLVSPRVLKLADVSKKCVLNTITGARIFSPEGKSLTIGGDKTQAFSIDRATFDKDLASQAESAGAELCLGKRVINVGEEKIVLKTGEEMGFKFLVGADGPMSLVARTNGFPSPCEYIFGITAELSMEHDSSLVDIFFGKSISPGFFSWLIPGGEKVKVGLAVSQGYRPKTFLKAFLKHLGIKKTPRYQVGLIPLGPLDRPYRNNVILIGDAAGQVKPSSGGGLYPGFVAAKYCSTALIHALDNGGDLSSYYTQWFSEIGKEIKRGLFFRRLFLRMDDKKIEKIFQILTDTELIGLINKYGDIDYPSKVIFKALQYHPSFLRYFPSLLL